MHVGATGIQEDFACSIVRLGSIFPALIQSVVSRYIVGL